MKEGNEDVDHGDIIRPQIKKGGEIWKLYPSELCEGDYATIGLQLRVGTPTIPAPNNLLGDQTKQCSYHPNSGHSTKEWFKVKDLLKELLRLGPWIVSFLELRTAEAEVQAETEAEKYRVEDRVVGQIVITKLIKLKPQSEVGQG